MSKEVTMSREDYDQLTKRIEELEGRLISMESGDKDEEESEESSSSDHWYDSMGDTSTRVFKETTKMVNGFIDASVEAMNETAHAMSGLSEETRDNYDDIPGNIISMMRRAIDIQKKALDKFEDTYHKED